MRRSTLLPAALAVPPRVVLRAATALAVACTLSAGCAPDADDDAVVTPAVADDDHADGDHDHDHAEGHDHDGDGHADVGAHGGSLIELGDEDYHAELVHDTDAGTVTIYLLDGDAKEAAATAATDLSVTLSHDGEQKTFSLAADPQEGDADGRSSRFVSSDAGLGEELDHGHEDATLTVTIDGEEFSGPVAHSAASHED